MMNQHTKSIGHGLFSSEVIVQTHTQLNNWSTWATKAVSNTVKALQAMFAQLIVYNNVKKTVYMYVNGDTSRVTHRKQQTSRKVGVIDQHST